MGLSGPAPKFFVDSFPSAKRELSGGCLSKVQRCLIEHPRYPLDAGHVLANWFSRDWSFLKKEEKRLRGYPDDQQEPAGRYSQHDERPEMMILRLSSQWAFFFHTKIVFQLVGESQTIGCLRPRIKGGQRIPECAWHRCTVLRSKITDGAPLSRGGAAKAHLAGRFAHAACVRRDFGRRRGLLQCTPVLIAELQLGCVEQPLKLIARARPDNRRGDPRYAEQPRERDLWDRPFVLSRNDGDESTTRKLRSTARRAADSSKSSPARVTRPSAGMFARVYRPVRKPAPSRPHGRTPRPAALQKGNNSNSAERSTSEYWGCRLTKGVQPLRSWVDTDQASSQAGSSRQPSRVLNAKAIVRTLSDKRFANICAKTKTRESRACRLYAYLQRSMSILAQSQTASISGSSPAAGTMEMAPNERLASKEDRVGREEPLNLVLRNAWCSLANVRRVVCRRVVVSDLIVYQRGEHSPESRLSREARKK